MRQAVSVIVYVDADTQIEAETKVSEFLSTVLVGSGMTYCLEEEED